MCDNDGERCPVWREDTRKARKSHTCTGCGETIRRGDRYVNTASLFDGRWDGFKHCMRCHHLFAAISRAANAHHDEFWGSVAVDPRFLCGETWAENFGPPPPDVAALAFALPGDFAP